MARALVALLLATLVALAPAAARAEGRESDDRAVALKATADDLDHRLDLAREAGERAPLDRAEVDLAMARMALSTSQLLGELGEAPDRQVSWRRKAAAYLERARLHLTPSRGTETRGLFLDASSIPKTPAALDAFLDKVAAAHFNTILPEAIRRGYTLYPSRYTDQDPEFAGKGGLFAQLVTGAHLRCLQVVPWVWCFRVRSPGYGDPVLARLPAVAARSEHTTDPRFLSPADPRSRQFVVGLLRELTDRFDLDGVLLDYIRYDELTPEDWTSQTNFRLQYLARFGQYPPTEIGPGSPLYATWQLWREHQVDDAVERISHDLRAEHPELRIGVSTFRNERYTRHAKLQNWRHWADNGWIDYDSTMAYTARASDLSHWIQEETDGFTRQDLQIPILGPLRMDRPVAESLQQIDLVRGLDQPGVYVFSSGHVSDALYAALREGPFRSVALAPERNLVRATRKVLAELYLQDLPRLLPRASLDEAASLVVLRDEVGSVARSLPLDDSPYLENQPLLARLKDLADLTRAMARGHHLNPAVAGRVRAALAYAEVLVRANAHKVGATHYVPPTLPPGIEGAPAPEMVEP